MVLIDTQLLLKLYNFLILSTFLLLLIIILPGHKPYLVVASPLKTFFLNIPITTLLNNNSGTKRSYSLNNYVLLTMMYYLIGLIYLLDYFTFLREKSLHGLTI